VAHGLLTIFAVGVKGVTEKRTSPHNVLAVEPPKRPPDSTVEQCTSPDQVRTGMHMLHTRFTKQIGASDFISRGSSVNLKQDTDLPDCLS
jgi:hypothetical protein